MKTEQVTWAEETRSDEELRNDLNMDCMALMERKEGEVGDGQERESVSLHKRTEQGYHQLHHQRISVLCALRYQPWKGLQGIRTAVKLNGGCASMNADVPRGLHHPTSFLTLENEWAEKRWEDR